MNLRKYFATCLVFISLFISSMVAANQYTLETVITDIDIPWGMAQLPDGNFLVTDRDGTLYHANPKTKKNIKITGLPKVNARGQGGLLDIELHPEYKKNGWVYLSLSSPEGSGRGDNTAIYRGKIKNFQLVDSQLIYKATPNSTRRHHYGSRIEFDKEGYLFFTIGDRGDRDTNPQDLSLDAGKVYRLHDDGRIPKDNPFVNRKGAKQAIYSYGHRNPQGMEMNPATGQIWTHEHGPKGGDEINIIQPGKNYGWPVISYGVNYSGTKFTDLTHKEGMEQPITYWVPSIAPSGMTFVTSDKYPQWKGHLLVGSLKFGYVELCQLDGNKVVGKQKLFEGVGRT
ncbi:MAG: PQQ-dependent sugar dehydrogenase, partial [Kangiellaceae bacterium]|nr:PQQ-dependent sugar dehydrogenase [Kangiellaceae bacterium]